MPSVKKLDETDIQEILSIQQRYASLKSEIGEIEMDIYTHTSSISDLTSSKALLMKDYEFLMNSDKELAAKLSDKYGTGTINIETGEIISQD